MIPKIIHQIWVGDREPPLHWIETWKKKHPDWQHILWTEKEIETLDLPNKQAYEFYKKEKLWFGMSDIARVAILKKYGGVYIDADTICLQKLNSEWLNNDFVCAYSPATRERVANGVMFTAPNGRVITEYAKALSKQKEFIPVWKTVGSGVLTPIVEKHIATTLVLPAITFYHKTSSGAILNGNRDDMYSFHFYHSTTKKETIRATWSKLKNFGDTLTPHILEYFTDKKVVRVNPDYSGKVVGVGSIMTFLRDNDVVFGTGVMYPHERYKADNIHVIALRGPITRSVIDTNSELPEIYGDPAILLPLMYYPVMEKKYDVGYIPHFVDKEYISLGENDILIDLRPENIENDWKQVVDLALQCKKIVSSSLHGIILGESYGIPTVWEQYSDKIIGGEYKFQDYFLGTGRKKQKTGVVLDAIPDLPKLQQQLLDSLYKYYGRP